MPTTLADGSEWPTPEETVVALLEQGYTPVEIIRDAEVIINGGDGSAMGLSPEEPGKLAEIAYVDAVAADHQGSINNAIHAQNEAQEAVNLARRGGADHELLKKAEELLGDAIFCTQVAGNNADDAVKAAEQHRGHATEAINNARARVAAANDSKLVDPALARFKALKAAEAKALKAGASS